MSIPARRLGENQWVRRGLVLASVWMLGVVVAVALAFAAVQQVASGVAPHDVAHLSQSAIDDQLAAQTSTSGRSPSGGSSSTTSTTKPAMRTTTSTRSTTPSVSTPTTRAVPGTTETTVTSNTTATTNATNVTGTTETTTTTTIAAQPHDTVTTSEGGTLFTHCSGPETIVYVAAVPKSGYARTVDVESPRGIRQAFTNAHHRSTIQAECSDHVVHVEVEEESTDD